MFWALLIIALAANATPNQEELVQVSTIPRTKERRIGRILPLELGNPAGDDLALCMRPLDDEGRGSFELYRRRASGRPFGARPDVVLDLTDDVVALGAGDLLPAKGIELLMLSPSGAFARSFASDTSFADGDAGRSGADAEAGAVERLFACSTLWQVARPGAPLDWRQGVVDMNGDGLDDVLIPEAGGYRVAIQARSAGEHDFETLDFLELPNDEALLGEPLQEARGLVVRGGGVSLDLDFGPRSTGSLLEIEHGLPAPRLVDFDGDQRLDLLALGPAYLHRWSGNEHGFERAAISTKSPVIRDVRRRLDLAFAAECVDLDGDGLQDLVLIAGDQRADKPRAQVLLHRQKTLSENEPAISSRPDQVLVLDGLVLMSRLVDVNGDGRVDLVAATLRQDLLDQIRDQGGDSIEMQLLVFANTNGVLSKRPALSHRVKVEAGGSGPLIRFVGDVTGNGISELLMRPAPNRLTLQTLDARRVPWRVVERPLWSLGIHADSNVVPKQRPRPARDTVVVIEPEQFLHLEFGQ